MVGFRFNFSFFQGFKTLSAAGSTINVASCKRASMKTLLLSFVLILSAVACNPRDPDVLSDADKNRRGGSQRNGEQRVIQASRPQNLELFLA
jgi:hypothetical protein